MKAVHEVAKLVPLDRLLLETDAPYFLPAKLAKSTSYPYRFSQPGHIVHVAAQVAALRNISIDEVLEANKKNIAEIYGLSKEISKQSNKKWSWYIC